jgi:hypothetical protein
LRSFSIKPGADFVSSNYWGMPSSDGHCNYGKVFFEIVCYLLEFGDFTVPAVIGAII